MDIPALPFSRSEFKAKKPIRSDYPNNPSTIGDYIKKRRLDLHLTQNQIAVKLLVTEDCIRNWENGNAYPQINYYPRINSFLGFDVFSTMSTNLEGEIKRYRVDHGLSYKKMGELLNVNGTTISLWESNLNGITADNKNRLMKLLKKENST
jgi:DNA-binding transcriptional regulator YiaG